MLKIVFTLLFLTQIISARIILKDGKSNDDKIQFGKDYILIPVKRLGLLKDTVSRFPPVLEFLLQMVQRYFSNYVYEDLSRPPAWDSPNYGTGHHSQFATKINKTKTNDQP